MFRTNGSSILAFPAILVVVLLLASCATPPPTQEMADADAALAEAKAAGAPDCGADEYAAAESALAKGKSLASEFCHELEARRMLIDAKAKADEAKFKCMKPPPPPPNVLGMKDIFFNFDKSSIRADADPILQEDAQILMDNPSYTVVIEGYADIRGPDAYNVGLARRRADSTRSRLIELGVDAGRISTVSKGETTKFAEGKSMESYQLNRRAHFVPQSSGSMPGARLIIQTNQ